LFVPLTAKIMLSTYPIIVICNAVWFGLAWPYILVLLGGVLGAIFSFYLLVTSTWTSEDDA